LQFGSYGAAPYGEWIQTKDANNAGPYNYPLILQPVNGNVGIGASSPKASLDIKQAGNSWEDSILLQHNDANTGWNIHSEVTNKGLWFGYNSDTSVALTSQNASAKFMIEGSTGNVGIGTTSPDSKLEIAGDMHLSGNLKGKSDHTTELGHYNNGLIKRIRMAQGGELHFGDTTTTNFLGLTEGTVDSFGDTDRLGLYYRNELKMYSNTNTLRFTMNAAGNAIFSGTVSATATATLLIINSAGTTVKTINGIG
jgi:hypothetical protein